MGAFKNAPYTLLVSAVFISYLGLYTGSYLPLTTTTYTLHSTPFTQPTQLTPSPFPFPSIVLTYIDVAGVANGLDPNFTFYLVSIANAGSVFGRLAAGVLSDRFGPFDVLISFSMLAAVTTYVWPYCVTKGGYYCVGYFLWVRRVLISSDSSDSEVGLISRTELN